MSRFVVVDVAGSTNTLLREMEAEHGTAVHAVEQTSGRGQKGNSWESAPGENVTLSVMLRPEGLAAADQFVISEAVAVAAADMVRARLERSGVSEAVCVKWPNDIYVGDKKIAGILIENTIGGDRVSQSIVGIGLNVNQERFVSDAPNPVSLWNLTGVKEDPVAAARELAERIVGEYESAAGSAEARRELEARYLGSLYRREGEWRWRDLREGCELRARIGGVDRYGRLVLVEEGKELEPYSFKEVGYCF